MTRQKAVETRRDRKSFAQEAGMGGVSLWSVLAGVFLAYGLFAVLAALTAGVLSAVGVDTAALTSNDWHQLGIGSAIVAAVVLFVSYFFGGYVAGRMARRAGAVNGVLVFHDPSVGREAEALNEIIGAEKRQADYQPQRPSAEGRSERIEVSTPDADRGQRDGSQSQRNASRRS